MSNYTDLMVQATMNAADDYRHYKLSSVF